MAMQYKSKCYRCGGSGKGCLPIWNDEWYKQHPDFPCMACDGKGYNEYDLRIESFYGTFSNAEAWTDEPDGVTDIDNYQDDITIWFNCSCGDEIFLSEFTDMKVCSCGRVYRLSGRVEKSDERTGDMEYWEKVKQDKNDYQDKLLSDAGA